MSIREVFSTHKRLALVGSLSCALIAGVAVFLFVAGSRGGETRRPASKPLATQAPPASSLQAQAPHAPAQAPHRPGRSSVKPSRAARATELNRLVAKHPRDLLAQLRRRGVRVVEVKPSNFRKAAFGTFFPTQQIDPRTVSKLTPHNTGKGRPNKSATHNQTTSHKKK